jgi:putative copper export protein
MHAEPLFQWSKPATEFAGFVALFLANGAVGFRYAAVRGRLRSAESSDGAVRLLYEAATQRAASLGLTGALVLAGLLAFQLPHLAERMHRSVGQLLTTDPVTIARTGLLLVAIVGFAMAAARRWSGWPVAAAGLIGSELAVLLAGRLQSVVNPLHQLFGGFWLGTLAVLVIAGMATVLRGPAGLRGPVVADLVNGFSPLALTCGPLLVLTGVITAVLHLQPLSSLWSTPYGYALLVKLGLVAGVFALGAWNWRRQRPRLGSEAASVLIRRSSVWELSVATAVLLATAVLVSLPSPKAMAARQAPAAQAPAGQPPAGAGAGH